jgi:hypothetical protein
MSLEANRHFAPNANGGRRWFTARPVGSTRCCISSDIGQPDLIVDHHSSHQKLQQRRQSTTTINDEEVVEENLSPRLDDHQGMESTTITTP